MMGWVLLGIDVLALLVVTDLWWSERQKRLQKERESEAMLDALSSFWNHERLQGRIVTSEDLRLDLSQETPGPLDAYSDPDEDPTVRTMPAARPWPHEESSDGH